MPNENEPTVEQVERAKGWLAGKASLGNKFAPIIFIELRRLQAEVEGQQTELDRNREDLLSKAVYILKLETDLRNLQAEVERLDAKLLDAERELSPSSTTRRRNWKGRCEMIITIHTFWIPIIASLLATIYCGLRFSACRSSGDYDFGYIIYVVALGVSLLIIWLVYFAIAYYTK